MADDNSSKLQSKKIPKKWWIIAIVVGLTIGCILGNHAIILALSQNNEHANGKYVTLSGNRYIAYIWAYSGDDVTGTKESFTFEFAKLLGWSDGLPSDVSTSDNTYDFAIYDKNTNVLIYQSPVKTTKSDVAYESVVLPKAGDYDVYLHWKSNSDIMIGQQTNWNDFTTEDRTLMTCTMVEDNNGNVRYELHGQFVTADEVRKAGGCN